MIEPGHRRLDVGVGQPGVQREHRDLDREGDREGEEHPRPVAVQRLGQRARPLAGLGWPGSWPARGWRRRASCRRPSSRSSAPPPAGPTKYTARMRHQHHQRAGQGVEEELHRRLGALLRAPDPDDQVHGDQHRLEEDVEEHHVQRGQRAQHRGLDEQQREVEALDPLVDEGPAGQHHHRAEEAGEQHQGDRQPVDAHVVADAQIGDPRHALLELELPPAGVEGRVERDGEGEVDQHRHEGPGADQPLLALGQEPHQRPADQGLEDHRGHQPGGGGVHRSTQVRTAAMESNSPTAITVA